MSQTQRSFNTAYDHLCRAVETAYSGLTNCDTLGHLLDDETVDRLEKIRRELFDFSLTLDNKARQRDAEIAAKAA